MLCRPGTSSAHLFSASLVERFGLCLRVFVFLSVVVCLQVLSKSLLRDSRMKLLIDNKRDLKYVITIYKERKTTNRGKN